MPKHIVLLRGINVGSHNRIAMGELRELLDDAGFAGVRTYLQSGNVVLSSSTKPDQVARICERLIEQAFGLEIDVVVRSRAQLAQVVGRNPLGKVATDPKLYQVSFLATKPAAALVRRLEGLVAPPEQLAVNGREIYAWHPRGVARSKLWAALASRQLGVPATARNWATVTKLLELAGE